MFGSCFETENAADAGNSSDVFFFRTISQRIEIGLSTVRASKIAHVQCVQIYLFFYKLSSVRACNHTSQ